MSRTPHTARPPAIRLARNLGGAACALALLAGCDDAGQFSLTRGNGGMAAATEGTRATNLVERDVEAPEVFSATDQGLWDGRPSLGGVWVAHPDVSEPERVIIRNEANGKFVIGALFRRERELPGPRMQISSDAASALEVLAGAPAPLNVTALRREEAPAEDAASFEDAPAVDAPAEVVQASLDPVAAAGAAIDAAPDTTVAAAAPAVAAPAPSPTAPASAIDKPFVQIGIFSVEANADRAANQMRSAGMIPTVKRSEINGKPFWRVVVGPAQTRGDLTSLLGKIKAEGFSDAYAVSS